MYYYKVLSLDQAWVVNGLNMKTSCILYQALVSQHQQNVLRTTPFSKKKNKKNWQAVIQILSTWFTSVKQNCADTGQA